MNQSYALRLSFLIKDSMNNFVSDITTINFYNFMVTLVLGVTCNYMWSISIQWFK